MTKDEISNAIAYQVTTCQALHFQLAGAELNEMVRTEFQRLYDDSSILLSALEKYRHEIYDIPPVFTD